MVNTPAFDIRVFTVDDYADAKRHRALFGMERLTEFRRVERGATRRYDSLRPRLATFSFATDAEADGQPAH